MRKTLYILLASCLWMACGDDEKLENSIDFSTPYEISDDPNDPIQHRVYNIYQKYGVSVFFNDTVQKTYVGNDHQGRPMYRYETIDLNWNFTSHDVSSVGYTYHYLTTEEEKENALRFVDIYLERASKPMYPFSIFLTDTIYVRKNGEVTKPKEPLSKFRTMAVAQLRDYDEEQIDSMSVAIISSSVIEKIKLNADLVARFGSVSSKNNYYNKAWYNDGTNGGLGCLPATYFALASQGGDAENRKLGANTLFDEKAYENSQSYNPSSPFYPDNGWTEEAFEAARATIIGQIGQFGFISGSKYTSHISSPDDVNADLEFFVSTMVDIGDTEFKNRYGKSPLVMKKYEILYDYIVNTLEVEL